jgi:hypothetical protein
VIASIYEKTRESRLRWFCHMYRRVINAAVRNGELIQVEETKKYSGRPKITLVEVVTR